MCMIDTEREGRLGNLQRSTTTVAAKESASSTMAPPSPSYGARVARVDAAATSGVSVPFGGDDFEPNHVYIPPSSNNNNRTIASGNQQQQPYQQQPPPQQQQYEHQVSLSESTSQQPPARVTMASAAGTGQAQYANGGVPSSISFPTAPAGSGMPPLQQASAPSLLPPLAQVAGNGAPAGAPRPVHMHMLDRRQQFLVFVKILLKQLATTNNEALVKTVKKLLQECIVKNRQGDPHYQPLHLAAESRILPLVGAVHWNRSLQYLQLFLKKQAHAKTLQASASATASAFANSNSTAAPVSVPI